jgi:indole-3-glycerol phosphate synthase
VSRTAEPAVNRLHPQPISQPTETILQRIVASKMKELEISRAACALPEMMERVRFAPAPRGFLRALSHGSGTSRGSVALIAEIKRASPSAGVICETVDPAAVAGAYAAGGASALSVLTDGPYFKGRLEDMAAARSAVAIPVLRKDFTLDPYHVYEARAAGADAVLLIVAILDEERLKSLYGLALDLGMDALVEVHTPAEMAMAARMGPNLVGINNRNLKTFETRLECTAELAAMAPRSALLAALSGIRTRQDVAAMATVGARAVLVGESLMRQPDIAAAARSLCGVPVRDSSV